MPRITPQDPYFAIDPNHVAQLYGLSFFQPREHISGPFEGGFCISVIILLITTVLNHSKPHGRDTCVVSGREIAYAFRVAELIVYILFSFFALVTCKSVRRQLRAQRRQERYLDPIPRFPCEDPMTFAPSRITPLTIALSVFVHLVFYPFATVFLLIVCMVPWSRAFREIFGSMEVSGAVITLVIGVYFTILPWIIVYGVPGLAGYRTFLFLFGGAVDVLVGLACLAVLVTFPVSARNTMQSSREFRVSVFVILAQGVMGGVQYLLADNGVWQPFCGDPEQAGG